MFISTKRGLPVAQRYSELCGFPKMEQSKRMMTYVRTSHVWPEAVVVVLEQIVQEEGDVLGGLGDVQRAGGRVQGVDVSVVR